MTRDPVILTILLLALVGLSAELYLRVEARWKSTKKERDK